MALAKLMLDRYRRIPSTAAAHYSTLNAPRSIVFQLDDPRITLVSTATAATALSVFVMLFVFIGHTFLLVRYRGGLIPPAS